MSRGCPPRSGRGLLRRNKVGRADQQPLFEFRHVPRRRATSSACGVRRARPQSRIFTAGSASPTARRHEASAEAPARLSRKRFAGLMSRWISPSWCACCKPCAACRISRTPARPAAGRTVVTKRSRSDALDELHREIVLAASVIGVESLDDVGVRQAMSGPAVRAGTGGRRRAAR